MNLWKNRYIRISLACAIACYFLIVYPQNAHPETTKDLYNFLVVLPGMTQAIDVVQILNYPLGCARFFIFIVGKGSLGISLKNDNTTTKETMFMLGVAHSSSGTFPIYRLGVSNGIISQIVEIGDDGQPYGFVWLYCGIAQADQGPAYEYELRFSFQP